MATTRQKSNTSYLEDQKIADEILGIKERDRALTQPLLKTKKNVSFKIQEEVHRAMTNQKLRYPTYQVPPSIELALEHQMRTRPSKKIYSDPLKAGSPAPSPSFLYPTSKMVHQGDTLPLYFNFLYYVLSLSIIFSINQLIYLYIQVHKACEEYYFVNDCKFGLGILFLDVDMPDVVDLKVATSDIMQIANIGTLIGFIVSNVVFERAQRRIRMLSKSCLCASNYTVMIGNVGVGDSDQKIKDYVEDKARKLAGIEDLDILKINRTSINLRNTSLKKQLNNLEKTLKSLEKFKVQWEPQPRSDSSISGEQPHIENVEIIEKKISKVQKELEALKASKLKKCNDLLKPFRQSMKSDMNSVAFVTIADPSHVRKLLKHKTCIIFCIFRLRCFCCKKKYKLLEPPKPEQVSWDNVGFVTISRHLTLLITLLIHIFCLYSLGDFLGVVFTLNNSLKEIYSKSFILLISISFLFWLVIKVYIVFISFIMKFVTGAAKFLSKNDKMASLAFMNSFIETTYFQTMVLAGKLFISSQKTNEGVIDARNRLAKLIASYLFLSCLILSPVVFTFTYDRIYKYINWKLCFGHFRRKAATSSNSEAGKQLEDKESEVKLTRFDLMTQKELNELLELPECPIEEHYTYISSIFLLSLPLAIFPPAVTLSCLMIIILQLIFDKWLFYYHYKVYSGSTYLLNKTLMSISEYYLTILSLYYLVTNLIRLFVDVFYNEKVTGMLEVSTLIFLFISIIPYRLIKGLVNKILDLLVGGDDKYEVTLPRFDEVEPFLATDYDRENPLTSSEALSKWKEVSSIGDGESILRIEKLLMEKGMRKEQ